MNKFMNKEFLLSILAISIVPFSSNAATVYSKDSTSLDVFGSVSAMAMPDMRFARNGYSAGVHFDLIAV